MAATETEWNRLDWSGSGQGQVSVCCKHCNEPLGSIKFGKFFDYLYTNKSYWQYTKHGTRQCSVHVIPKHIHCRYPAKIILDSNLKIREYSHFLDLHIVCNIRDLSVHLVVSTCGFRNLWHHYPGKSELKQITLFFLPTPSLFYLVLLSKSGTYLQWYIPLVCALELSSNIGTIMAHQHVLHHTDQLDNIFRLQRELSVLSVCE
jgi:hypothetical protein